MAGHRIAFLLATVSIPALLLTAPAVAQSPATTEIVSPVTAAPAEPAVVATAPTPETPAGEPAPPAAKPDPEAVSASAAPEKPAEPPTAATPTPPAPASASADTVAPRPEVAPAPAQPAAATEPAPAPSPAATAPPVPPPAAEPAPVKAQVPDFRLPILDAVRTLAGRSFTIDKRDREAIEAFYTARNEAPLWTNAKGLSDKGRQLRDELGRADDWGLKVADLKLPEAPASPASAADLAELEVRLSVATLIYARHARGGRAQPTAITKYLDRQLSLRDPAKVLADFTESPDPAPVLKRLHPQHPQFERLRQKYLELRQASDRGRTAPQLGPGPKLVSGARHPDVVILRARLELANGHPVPPTGSAETYDDALVEAVKAFQSAQGLTPVDGIVGPATRNALNTISQGDPRKLLTNMEQWRWMPDDLGETYIWANIPEFALHVVKDGRIIHTERMIVGKLNTQTPIFSDVMKQVIFHPFWGVPESIKLNEVLPGLQRGGGVLAKHNLRIQSGGRDIDPRSVDWRVADIRRFHVYQPPGADNVLGVVKFRFPNKHDVYMHDTPTKNLFSSATRTYSHGCMRVRDPMRLAEILLAEDRQMPADKVRALAARGAPENNALNLTKRIPVHMTYFTALVDDDGKARYFRDIYAHEERIALGIEGKMHLIKPVPEPEGPQRAEAVARLSETPTGGGNFFNWFGGGFSGGGPGGGSSSSSGGVSRDRDWVNRAFGNN